ncbi:MAG: YidC/Oxa1 family membrane protein insertase [Patescibacteria group bacterium]
MDFLSDIIQLGWHEVLFRPLYNLLLVLYVFLGREMGFAIIGLVVLIRVVLLPFSFRQGRAEKRLATIQPDLEAIRKRYSHDLDKQKIETKRLLSENRIGIWANVLSLGAQFLILAVLYSIFSSAVYLDNEKELYSFILPVFEKYSGGTLHVNFDFFGLFSLVLPYVWASLVAALIVFIHQSVRPSRGKGSLTALEKWMVFSLPVFTFVVTMVLPSSKAVFVGVSVLISFILGLFRAAFRKAKKI